MSTQPSVFIDLEGVLIDDWQNRAVLFKNKKIIELILSQMGTNNVCMFSYAIDNMKDYIDFMKFANHLELAFNINIDDTLTVQEIMDVIGTKDIMWEFKMAGKRDGFIKYILAITALARDATRSWSFVLIDDNVENEVVMISPNITVTFIHVD